MGQPQQQLHLPEVDPLSGFGGHLVRRVVPWTLVVIGLLALLAIAISLTTSATLTVRASGTLEPARVWTVRAQEGGLLSRVLVATGDSVKTGQLIGFISSPALAADKLQVELALRDHLIGLARARAVLPTELRQREQRVAQSQARLIQARANLRERLVSFGFREGIDSVRRDYVIGTHVEIDRAYAELEIAESETRAAIAEQGAPLLGPLDVAREESAVLDSRRRDGLLQERLTHLAVVSPIDGLVLTAHSEELLGVVLRPGDAVLDIADKRWKAVLHVSERDIRDIAVGDQVMMEVPALVRTNGRRIQGTVDLVASAPIGSKVGAETSGGAGYEVIVRIDIAELHMLDARAIRKGLSVDARIVTRSGRILQLIREYFVEQFRSARRTDN